MRKVMTYAKIKQLDRQRLLELFWEFTNYIEKLHTLYLDSVVGYSILHERLQYYQNSMIELLKDSELATEEFQDTCSMSYEWISNRNFTPISMSPVMNQGRMKHRLHDDGENALLLGQQCVVSAYAYWEEFLRLEIGKAIGALQPDVVADDVSRKILNRAVRSEFWGDMRHIRNAIVHSSGVASSDIKKCQILKWFSPGEEIRLTHERMQKIFLLMGYCRNELHQMSLPDGTFRISAAQ